MKFSNASKLFWGGVIAISTAALAPLPASAQTTTQPGTAETTVPGTTDISDDDDGSDWGWLGLLGLIGLAGLAGRKESCKNNLSRQGA
ncbi:MAG: WGxxGxxG family protein [Elainella sp.]